MNKIVRQHYPASKLPEELREGLDPTGRVTVTIVQEERAARREELVKLLDQARRRSHSTGGVTAEEAVTRIRALRDEWDA